MVIDTLPRSRADAAIALWVLVGLTRPWNDPRADLERALGGPSSTVLAALDGEILIGTVMVGHDGHRENADPVRFYDRIGYVPSDVRVLARRLDDPGG